MVIIICRHIRDAVYLKFQSKYINYLMYQSDFANQVFFVLKP